MFTLTGDLFLVPFRAFISLMLCALADKTARISFLRLGSLSGYYWDTVGIRLPYVRKTSGHCSTLPPLEMQFFSLSLECRTVGVILVACNKGNYYLLSFRNAGAFHK
ncbi:hypothetical protein V8C42DRAFT_97633 [Trichoderma barbatum]